MGARYVGTGRRSAFGKDFEEAAKKSGLVRTRCDWAGIRSELTTLALNTAMPIRLPAAPTAPSALQFDEHKKATGSDSMPPNGYPDMGSGRFAALLPYGAWLDFNNRQRVCVLAGPSGV